MPPSFFFFKWYFNVMSGKTDSPRNSIYYLIVSRPDLFLLPHTYDGSGSTIVTYILKVPFKKNITMWTLSKYSYPDLAFKNELHSHWLTNCGESLTAAWNEAFCLHDKTLPSSQIQFDIHLWSFEECQHDTPINILLFRFGDDNGLFIDRSFVSLLLWFDDKNRLDTRFLVDHKCQAIPNFTACW